MIYQDSFCKKDGSRLPCAQHGNGFAVFESELPLPEQKPTLAELLEKARLHVMTPEEKEAQRQSWVKGETGLDRGDDGYGKTTVFPMHGGETGRFSGAHPNASNTPQTDAGAITYGMLIAAGAKTFRDMPLTFAEYQSRAGATAVFPHHIPDELAGVVYCALGLAGEAGEVAGKIKKLLRDGDSTEKRRKIVAEVGDTLWYIPELLHELGEFTLEQCARENLEKLLGRKERGTIHGDGDAR